MSEEGQALCFFAGANSIFYGDKLLTTKNPRAQADLALIDKLGLTPQEPYADVPRPACERACDREPAEV